MGNELPMEGNSSPWWEKTWRRSIMQVGPVILGFFVMVGLVVYLVHLVVSAPATNAAEQTTEIKAYVKDADDGLRADILAVRAEQVAALNRIANGQTQICKLLATNSKQQEAFCNF